MATTHSTLMTAEPDRAHTIGEVHALVRHQGLRYLDYTPYQVDSDSSFWKLMDRFMKAEEVEVRKPKDERERGRGRERERERGRERQTVSRPCGALTRLDFGYPRARVEKKYPNAIAIPIKGRRRRRRWDELFSDYDEGETRTERFLRREKDRQEEARIVFPYVLHEDQLLDLCSDLTYRIKCIEQATKYAKVLRSYLPDSGELVTIPDCEEIDLHKWLTEGLYRTGPEFAMKQVAFDSVQKLVEQAQLFEMPRRGKEEKAIKYITIAVIVKEGWSEAYSGTSGRIADDIKMLVARRHMILRADMFEPVYIRDYVMTQREKKEDQKDELHVTKSSQSTAVIIDNTKAVTLPIIVRGGFGK